ncbi:MAG: hypothetical protein R3D85_05780 [Paracoccaceae bacterium]
MKSGVMGLAMALMAGGVEAQQMQHMHEHGAGGMMAHDEATMPGLRGLDATAQESAEMAVMFRNFHTLRREVENLPDGIRTRTFSTDPAVMEALTSHIVGMIDRVEMGRDPQVFIQSPTLDIFFERRDSITTDIDIQGDAIVVTQTSDDPEMVEALHIHAGEVSAMAARGMQAVHEMMMARQGN